MARTVSIIADATSGRFFVAEADSTRIPLNRDGYSTSNRAFQALERFYSVLSYCLDTEMLTITLSGRELAERDRNRAEIIADHDIAQEASSRLAAPVSTEARAAAAETVADALVANFDHDGAPRARGCTCDGYQLRMVGCDCSASEDAPAPAPQPVQRPASPSRRSLFGAIFGAGVFAALGASVATAKPALRGGDTNRLPDHAAFWTRLPLPFSLPEAWRLLAPEVQTEIGVAVLGMHLAQYIHGGDRGDADQFHDDEIRGEAIDVAHDLLNRMDDRLWSLFPDLYGPEGDHPRWALDSGLAA